MQIQRSELMEHMEFRLRSYSCEASEIGLRPGIIWPQEITVPGLGNGNKFYRARIIWAADGDFGGQVYRQLHGCLSLTIFND